MTHVQKDVGVLHRRREDRVATEILPFVIIILSPGRFQGGVAHAPPFAPDLGPWTQWDWGQQGRRTDDVMCMSGREVVTDGRRGG